MKPKKPLCRIAYSEGCMPKSHHWYFRISNDWQLLRFLNCIEFLSFCWDKECKWITVLGFSFIWERYDTSEKGLK